MKLATVQLMDENNNAQYVLARDGVVSRHIDAVAVNDLDKCRESMMLLEDRAKANKGWYLVVEAIS